MTHKIAQQMRRWLGRTSKIRPSEPSPQRIEFQLMYKQMSIGILALQSSVWEWSYSDEFRAQEKLVPLIEFPDVNRTYRTEELWPFFATRAPSLKRPDILQIIEREHIDKNDEVALLKRFGQRTITNPFELVSA